MDILQALMRAKSEIDTVLENNPDLDTFGDELQDLSNSLSSMIDTLELVNEKGI